MRKRTLVIAAALLTCTLASCLAVAVFWDGYYLPYKPCRPIGYPTGAVVAQEGHDYDFSTGDNLATVVSFYDARLMPTDGGDPTNHWAKETLPASNYLYRCYGSDVNLLTTETGCIYVEPQIGGTTQIRISFFRGEGNGWPCLHQ